MSNKNQLKLSSSGRVSTLHAPPDTSLRKGVVYMYVFPNGKRYVGQSWNIKKRHNEHINKNKLVVDYAHTKYGAQPYIILKICFTQEDLDACEIAFIEMYRTRNRKYGYNIRRGGKGGRHSPETVAKLREISKGNKHALGYRHTQEAKNKISKLHKGNTYCLGRKDTNKTRGKKSKSQIGNQNAVGKRGKLTEEHRQKLMGNKNGRGNKGVKKSEAHKRALSKAHQEYHKRNPQHSKGSGKGTGRIKGTSLSDETRKKTANSMRKYYKNNPMTQEHRDNIRAGLHTYFAAKKINNN